MLIKPSQIVTHSLQNFSNGDAVSQILAAAINGANPVDLIRKHIFPDGSHITIDNKSYDFNEYKNIYILGAGKACLPMSEAVCEILNSKIASGLLITKDKQSEGGFLCDKNVKVVQANHPIPDQRNIDASNHVKSFCSRIKPDDLIFVLLSGGASSLLMNPSPGIFLEDIQVLTSILLNCGASITEINTIRKHIDGFKGGGLVRFMNHATVVSLILSDVLGDNLEAIASGPTVPDQSTFENAWNILLKYQILDQVPSRIKSLLTAGLIGALQETIKPGDQILDNVYNSIIGNNQNSVASAQAAAQNLGFNTILNSKPINGEAAEYGRMMAEDAKSLYTLKHPSSNPICMISGGESTVTVHGSGKGGRNQELALGAVKELAGLDPIIIASMATDGVDGLTDAAGAIATNDTYRRGLSLGFDPQEYLIRNDSYSYFESLGDLIIIGPTLTNVNDLVFVIF